MKYNPLRISDEEHAYVVNTGIEVDKTWKFSTHFSWHYACDASQHDTTGVKSSSTREDIDMLEFRMVEFLLSKLLIFEI